MKDRPCLDMRRKNWVAIARRVMALTALSLVLGLSNNAQAAGPMGRTLGVGLALGNPTSFTGKYHLGEGEAIDLHLGKFHTYGHSFWNNSIFLGADYLFELWSFLENSSVKVPLYAGPGVGLLVNTSERRGYRFDNRFNYNRDGHYDFGFGPRLPIGVGIEFQKVPFELFIEMAPTMMILFRDAAYGDRAIVRFDIPNFALIARFYFD